MAPLSANLPEGWVANVPVLSARAGAIGFPLGYSVP